MRKTSALFLCRHNAVRSQMAEALLRARFPAQYDAASAGVTPTRVHPLAVRVLEEAGVATAGLSSKHVEAFLGRTFDIVATVCGDEEPACPFSPGGRQIHRSFPDPSAMQGSDEEVLAAFRRTRDDIDRWIQATFAQ